MKLDPGDLQLTDVLNALKDDLDISCGYNTKPSRDQWNLDFLRDFAPVRSTFNNLEWQFWRSNDN